MRHPLQCVQLCRQTSSTGGSLLLGAAGPRIYLYNVEDGALLCAWPEVPAPTGVKDEQHSAENPEEQTAKREAPESEEGPPGKRRKVSSSADAKVGSSGRNTNTQSTPRLPVVSILSQSPDGKHIVAVTSEDKAIRVFELVNGTQLSTISTRCMPKRPSAIVVTSDGAILCADKFGDVYSLPLLETEAPAAQESKAEQKSDSPESREVAYVPAATHLTVHTARNRMALENQMRMSTKQVEKTGPSFAHDLLIGHVSMLTDMAYTTLETDEGHKKRYILTADRDEHIRISRAPPQAHIIERFCFGHREFVSKLCLPSWQPTRLISGGGDDYLFVWDWLHGKLLHKIELRSYIEKFLQPSKETENERTSPEDLQQKAKIAVSGIWDISFPNNVSEESAGTASFTRLVLVACEGIPALLSFSWTDEGLTSPPQLLELQGNVLGVAALPKNASILVSVDNSHKSSSTTEVRAEAAVPVLQAFDWSASDNALTKTSRFNNVLQAINGPQGPGTELSADPKNVRELIYGVENLRKRGHEE